MGRPDEFINSCYVMFTTVAWLISESYLTSKPPSIELYWAPSFFFYIYLPALIMVATLSSYWLPLLLPAPEVPLVPTLSLPWRLWALPPWLVNLLTVFWDLAFFLWVLERGWRCWESARLTIFPLLPDDWPGVIFWGICDWELGLIYLIL